MYMYYTYMSCILVGKVSSKPFQMTVSQIWLWYLRWGFPPVKKKANALRSMFLPSTKTIDKLSFSNPTAGFQVAGACICDAQVTQRLKPNEHCCNEIGTENTQQPWNWWFERKIIYFTSSDPHKFSQPSDIVSDITSGSEKTPIFYMYKNKYRYSDILSGILSGIYSDVLSSILSGIYSDIQSGKHADILSGMLSGIYSDILSDILSGIMSGIYSDSLPGILSGIYPVIFSHICSKKVFRAFYLASILRFHLAFHLAFYLLLLFSLDLKIGWFLGVNCTSGHMRPSILKLSHFGSHDRSSSHSNCFPNPRSENICGSRESQAHMVQAFGFVSCQKKENVKMPRGRIRIYIYIYIYTFTHIYIYIYIFIYI